MISLGLVGLFVWGAFVVNLKDGFNTLETEAPKAAQSLEAKYQVAKEFRLVDRVNSLIEQFRQPTGGALGAGESAGGDGRGRLQAVLNAPTDRRAGRPAVGAHLLRAATRRSRRHGPRTITQGGGADETVLLRIPHR